MIPRIIHYCWFGRGEKTKLAKKCIASWKKYCPDYKIIEWNEENFDINMNGYTRMCYEQKKYAFLSDYVRLLVVAEHGGIYFDTDVELLKPIDSLLRHPAYFGFEDEKHVNTGLGFGGEAGNLIIRMMLNEYFPLLEGTKNTIGCPQLNTQALTKVGLKLNGQNQDLEEAYIFDSTYFNPFDDATGRMNSKENTYSIHWYSKSWMSKKSIVRNKISRKFHRIFGVELIRKLNSFLKL